MLATDTPVGAGIPVCIKAKSTNTGAIGISKTSSKAITSSGQCFKISANQSVTVRLANLNEVYIDSEVSGEGVEVIFETSI